MSQRTPREQQSQVNSYAAYGSQAGVSETSRKTEAIFKDNVAMYQDLHSTLEGKVQTTHRLIDKLEARSSSMQKNLGATRTSLAQLAAAYEGKNEPLKLCAWRMEQRQKRPLKEHVRDQVEMALDEERSALQEAQKRLQDAMVMTKNIMVLLVDKSQELKGDIDGKMQALSVDELCLRTTQKSWNNSALGNKTPGGNSRVSTAVTPRQSSGVSQAKEVSSRTEMKRVQESRANELAARNREEAAAGLRKENELLVNRMSKLSKDALTKTEKCLNVRVAEVRQMTRRLQNELLDTQRRVENSKSTITETQSQIQAIQEPIALCSTHASWRKQRSDREQIMDPVELQLETQKQKLMRATEDLRTHRQNEKNALTALGEQAERLKEDLKDKTLALTIDEACLKAGAPSKSAQATPRSARATPRLGSACGTPKSARTVQLKLGMGEPYMLPQIGAGC